MRLLLMVMALAVFFSSACQKPAEKARLLSDIVTEADWVRIDLYDKNSAEKGFIDTKTYEVMDKSRVKFWHKLSFETGTAVTHLYLDCGQDKYRFLESATFDEKGNVLSHEGERPEWKPVAPGSNAEALCVTLDPAAGGIILKRDLPIIRELLLKGMRK